MPAWKPQAGAAANAVSGVRSNEGSTAAKRREPDVGLNSRPVRRRVAPTNAKVNRRPCVAWTSALNEQLGRWQMRGIGNAPAKDDLAEEPDVEKYVHPAACQFAS